MRRKNKKIVPKVELLLFLLLLSLELNVLSSRAMSSSKSDRSAAVMKLLKRSSNSQQQLATIKAANNLQLSAPKLTHQPPSEIVQLGGPHSVECPVEGEPAPEVIWFKDGQDLSKLNLAHLDQANRELSFREIQEEDEGEYQCSAHNDLGSVLSDRFRLTVPTSTLDQALKLEPSNPEVSAERPLEFACSLPLAVLEKTRQPEVSWRRNGKKLSVRWLGARQAQVAGSSAASESVLATGDDQLPDGETEADAEADEATLLSSASRFVSRRAGAGLYLLWLERALPEDDNATFTCLYKLPLERLAHESSPSRLRVHPTSSRHNITTLDVNLGPAIEQLDKTSPPTQTHRPSSTRLSISEIVDLVKPAILVLGLLMLVGLALLLQLAYIRRRTRQHRYMKHQYASAGSGGSNGSQGSRSVAGTEDSDPVLGSLMARTLSAPNSVSLAGAGRKFRSYRDHMRKVSALTAGYPQDSFDATGYKADVNQQRIPNQPFLPNLYNQSLAAREQARQLLQSADHMRSLSNLSCQQKHQLESLGHLNLGSHLNLPLGFALAAANNHRQQQTAPDSRLLLESLLASQRADQANWLPAATRQQQQQQQDLEHYQLVNCAGSNSPSSSSSSAMNSSSSSGRGTNNGNQQQRSSQNLPRDSSSLNHYSTIENSSEDLQQAINVPEYEELSSSGSSQPIKRHSSANTTKRPNQHHQPDHRTSTFVATNSVEQPPGRMAATTLLNLTGSSHSASSSSGCGHSTTSSSLVNAPFTASTKPTSNRQMGTSKKSNNSNHHHHHHSHQQQQQQQQQTRHYNNNDQLSPYAVSSICQSVHHHSKTSSMDAPTNQPPPITSDEAMRALNEQFNINQLMLLSDPPRSNSSSSPTFTPQDSSLFEAPPPPPSPPTNCQNRKPTEPASKTRFPLLTRQDSLH